MNKVIASSATVILLFLLLTSCSTSIEEYRETTPALDIKEYFTGDIIAWGMVQDHSKKVTRRFCVEIIGTWQQNKGVLAETFYFADGEVSYRNWQMEKLPEGKYRGTAEDVVGVATGQQQGFAFQWQYNLLVPVDGDVYQLFIDDWIYKIDDKRVFNKTTMNKFGVKVADITLFFEKLSQPAQCHSSIIG